MLPVLSRHRAVARWYGMLRRVPRHRSWMSKIEGGIIPDGYEPKPLPKHMLEEQYEFNEEMARVFGEPLAAAPL